jgi:integrase
VVIRRERKRVKGKAGAAGKASPTEREVVKHAMAHDLRRSFCTKWARRVMPATLQRLAQHASIQATLTYYVAQSAEHIATDLWAEWGEDGGKKAVSGNTYGNKGQETAKGSGTVNRT